jgi:hypothetical protein
MNTAAKLTAWLADPANYNGPAQPWPFTRNGFDHMVVRNRFECADGTTVSIQQGAAHYCSKDANTFEVWGAARPHGALAAYGDGEEPWAHVPFDIVVAYIDEHGGPAIKENT